MHPLSLPSSTFSQRNTPRAQPQHQSTTQWCSRHLPLQWKRWNEEGGRARVRRLRVGRRTASARTDHVTQLRSLPEPARLLGLGCFRAARRGGCLVCFLSHLPFDLESVWNKNLSPPPSVCLGKKGKIWDGSLKRTRKTCRSKAKLCPSCLESQ